MFHHAFLIFLILLSVSGAKGKPAPMVAYNPTEVFLFNCGNTSDNIDINGRKWTAEDPETLPLNAVNTSFFSNATSETNVPPYSNARTFPTDFTYSFSVSPGPKFVRLYFNPTRYAFNPNRFGYYFDGDDSIFSVTVNKDFTLLKLFKTKSVVMKEFIVPIYQTTLNLTFTPFMNSLAFVNGIEIVSMPDGLYSKGGFNNIIKNVGSSTDFKIGNLMALETIYRLNVGGVAFYDRKYIGMFRSWVEDDKFLMGSSGNVLNKPDVMINYTKETPAYVAPYFMYTTCRVMGNPVSPELNLSFNLTWLFKVDAGFSYLVRLHFCEIDIMSRLGQRVFSIFIRDQLVKRKMDVFQLSGGALIPMYLDFNVYVGSQSDLRLVMRPLNDRDPMYPDAILNGVEILKMSNSNGNIAQPYPNPIKLHDTRWKRVGAIIPTVVGSAVGLTILVVILMLLTRQMKRKQIMKENSVVMSKVLLKHYTYAELKKITKSFSHIVGKGGFGTVYGGKLCKGQKVAVKVLKDTKGNGEDFINEVASMSHTSHINIVSMLGFCFEGSKRAIIYEFLENGSLDQFLSTSTSSDVNVSTLYGIAVGVSRGLEYLHYGCKTRIVHFDIKPQNILLDDNLCPKVSDFGLAKICEKRESILSLMDARGTIGYIAPEVFSRMYGGISHKSDVYSYGMLVLEMIGARNKEIVETSTPDASSSYFPDWIYKDLENGDQTWIFGDEITKEEKEIVKKMILVSLWCIQPCPLDRPPMNRVAEMMEGSLDALEVPPKPSMHISTDLISESSSLVDGMESPS